MTKMTINRTLVERVLRCPVCGGPLSVSADGHSLLCGGARKHCFDVARSGYVNLVPTHSGGGDSREAVRARTEFLSTGAYERMSDELNELVCSLLPEGGILCDAGCGEGYYTNRLARKAATERHAQTVGFDLSRDAVDAAARGAARSGVTSAVFAVGSVFELPLCDASVDCLTNVFAPCAEEEYTRVLKPGGVLIVVGAAETHLLGLKKILYDNPYLNPGRNDLPKLLPPETHKRVTYETEVEGQNTVADLFSMTPYYWRTSVDDKEKLNGIEHLSTPVDMDFFVYRKPRG